MRKIASLLALLLLFTAMAFGQDRTITGTVTDETGAPVPGASIKIKGTRTGVAADNNGQFRILAKTGDILLITGTGLEPIDVTVGAGSTISIAVKKAIITGSEVVVTALGIRRTEKAIGYSISKVDPNSVLQKSEPDLLKGLQGKVPGVDIRTSQGTPGAATRIQIRGNSSFGLETQPLIVVDGVPFSNDQYTTSSQTSGGSAYGSGLANLDPNDIESFNILKGAAAAALYGSRASRGVIVITTKSGSGRKGAKSFNLSYKTSVSAEKIANLPKYQNSYGSGSQLTAGTTSNGSWGARFGKGVVYSSTGTVLRSSASGIDSIPAWTDYLNAYPELFNANGNTAYVAVPNNVKDMFNTGMLFENSVNVNGGDANTIFSLTASNTNHLGYVENSKYVRNNIAAGGQTKYKNLTIGGNVSFARSKQVGGFFGENQVDGASSQFARTMFLARTWDMRNLPFQDRSGKPLAFVPGQYDHPVWAAYHNTATTREERVIGGLRLGYRFNNWINLNYNIGINTISLGRDEITDLFSRAVGGLGRIREDNVKNQEIQSTAVMTFNPKIGKNFSLDFKLGQDINQRVSRRIKNAGQNFIVPGIYNLNNTSAKTSTSSDYLDDRSKRRIVGFFGDATLGYKNFVFVSVSGRNDRTSTLPYKNASYFYAGMSGSLVWTDAFKLRSNWLDYGKIRIGYAKVGNDAPANAGQDVFALSATNFLGLPYAGRSATTNDPNLTPEFTKELEIGTDLQLFKRRIALDFTWYNKKSTGLIYAVDVPTTTGYTSFNTNVGEISNKGVEIGLTVRPVVTSNFTWEIRGAFTQNKNMVVSFVDGLERGSLGGGFTGGISAWLEAGKPFGYLRGQVAKRHTDGQFLINPTTGQLVEATDQEDVGNPNPDYKLGITNTITYKSFSLSTVFDMTKGGDMYSVTVSSLLGRGVIQDTEDRETGWVIPGVYANPSNTQQVYLDAGGKPVQNQTRITTNDLYFGTTFAVNAPDEFNVWDATVYRLREMTLSYELPKTLISKLKLSAVSLSLSARNLWYLAPNFPKSSRFDPEVNSYGSSVLQGMELSAAPTTKRLGLNLNITF